MRERGLSLKRGVAAIVLLGMWVAPAFAGDGVLEINQACVAAGCFPGDPAGYPVSISAAGSYRLTSNLSVAAADVTAISIEVPHVTLDLGGFAISGVITCTGTPPSCASAQPGLFGYGVVAYPGYAVIRNGSVRGMNTGVAGGESTRVESVLVEGNGNAGINGSFGSDGWIVDRCIVRGNGAEGIRLNSGTGRGSLVTQSVVRGNGTFGVLGSVHLTHNTITSNGDFGSSGGGYLLGNVFAENKAGANTAQTNGASLLGGNWCGTDATCP